MLGPGDLRKQLKDIDGRSYSAYRSLAGSYDFGEFALHIDHVQGDPFAPPSRCRLAVPHSVAKYPRATMSDRIRAVSLRDFIARQIRDVIQATVKGRRGTGSSGRIYIDAGGQQVLERSAVVVTDHGIEARLDIGFPAYGRRIASKETEDVFFVELPRIVRQAMLFDVRTSDQLSEHIGSVVAQCALRDQLAPRKLVAFVADGSILPRESGGSQLPMDGEAAVLFESSNELSVSLELPNEEQIQGMGIPEGVTLIVGGGYHGKSTLLDAIQTGIYNHIPGDGRECVVTLMDTAKILAEDGRRVEGVDISPFIRDLPSGASTQCFRTENASGSTSQAANIVEALETGVRLLLIDEDTSATNFMIRDARMQRLIPGPLEPIVPFVDCARALYDKHGVSTILIMGGCGDYLDVADTVVMMERYRPQNATEKARRIVREMPCIRRRPAKAFSLPQHRRVPDPASIDSSRGHGVSRIATRGMDSVVFGTHEISLRHIEMLVDESQLRAVGQAIEFAKRTGILDGTRAIAEVALKVEEEIREYGVERVSPSQGQHPGHLAAIRRHDLAAGINRLPCLRLKEWEKVTPKASSTRFRRRGRRRPGRPRGC